MPIRTRPSFVKDKPKFSFISNIKIEEIPTNSDPVIPKKGNIKPGRYESEIVSISEVIENGELVAVDFVHKLSVNDEEGTRVKFRLYFPREIDLLAKMFSQYGFRGSLVDVIGMQENITLNENSKSSYLRITDRQLISLPQQKPAGALTSNRSTDKKVSATPNLLEDEDDDYLYEDD